MSNQNTTTQVVTLTGNLGGTPEVKILSGQTVSRTQFDPALDEVITEKTTKPDREIRVASLAINYKDADDQKQTRWIRLVDFQGYLAPYGKGDCLSVGGYFKTRNYLDEHGDEKEIREFVTLSCRAHFVKGRNEVPAPATDSDEVHPQPDEEDEIPF
jgi:single-stranded DNA-binding protein